MVEASVPQRFAAPLVDDRQYRILVESVTDYAIYMLDTDGVIASWNAGAERFKGYPAAEVIGRNFAIFYSEDDQKTGLPQRNLQIAAKHGRFESEGWRVRKDGHRFWASVVIDAIVDGGRLLGFAKITRDMSERKEAEHALAQTNAALLHSQKMETIGQLTGGIAHDFNNILTAVLGSLELLRNRLPDDPNAKRLLDNAAAGARLGTGLTQRMLAFARKKELAPGPVDLSALVRGMTALIEPSLGSAVTLEARLPATCKDVIVDANQFEMALLNLAVNARDALPNGGVIVVTLGEVLVSRGQVEGLADGLYACLSVQDAGVGMDDVTLARAIEPFYSTKGPGLGTGLGLSMVHGMAMQAGGRLLLKSKLGEGTIAELWFPIAPMHASEADAAGKLD